MKYYRPESIEEAIELLSEGVPLAGGTRLAPKRRGLEAVIDLERLGLDTISLKESSLHIGAAATLQALIDHDIALPADLEKACRLEAAWNLRNMATFGGTVMSADARSPLLLVLLALGTQVSVHGEPGAISLDEILDRRTGAESFLLEELSFELPRALSYEYVARAPADRPLVSAAASTASKNGLITAALGGFGERPVLLETQEGVSAAELKRRAAERYKQAADAFASAEYRSEIAAILVERVVEEVQS